MDEERLLAGTRVVARAIASDGRRRRPSNVDDRRGSASRSSVGSSPPSSSSSSSASSAAAASAGAASAGASSSAGATSSSAVASSSSSSAVVSSSFSCDASSISVGITDDRRTAGAAFSDSGDDIDDVDAAPGDISLIAGENDEGIARSHSDVSACFVRGVVGAGACGSRSGSRTSSAAIGGGGGGGASSSSSVSNRTTRATGGAAAAAAAIRGKVSEPPPFAVDGGRVDGESHIDSDASENLSTFWKNAFFSWSSSATRNASLSSRLAASRARRSALDTNAALISPFAAFSFSSAAWRFLIAVPGPPQSLSSPLSNGPWYDSLLIGVDGASDAASSSASRTVNFPRSFVSATDAACAANAFLRRREYVRTFSCVGFGFATGSATPNGSNGALSSRGASALRARLAIVFSREMR